MQSKVCRPVKYFNADRSVSPFPAIFNSVTEAIVFRFSSVRETVPEAFLVREIPAASSTI